MPRAHGGPQADRPGPPGKARVRAVRESARLERDRSPSLPLKRWWLWPAGLQPRRAGSSPAPRGASRCKRTRLQRATPPVLPSPTWRRPRRPGLKSTASLLEQRPEIEAAVARALDVHRGRHGQDLLRAALLLCRLAGQQDAGDPAHAPSTAGRARMVRRLQQPPASEHVEAFLLGASHGQLRSHFGIVFSHIDEAPVLDALLRKTHWLKDQHLQLCMHQVSRGVWWGDGGAGARHRTPRARGCRPDRRMDRRLRRPRRRAGRADGAAARRTPAELSPPGCGCCGSPAAGERGASVALLRQLPDRPRRAAGADGRPRDRPPQARGL